MPAEKRARTAKDGLAGGGGAAGGSSGSKFTMKAKPANGAQDKGKGKGRQQQQDHDDDDDEQEEDLEDLDDSEADDMSGLEAAGDEDDSEGEDSDEDDIVAANEDAQSRQKKKRKRALPQQAFGDLLSSLISAPAPTKPLRPLHPPPAAEALEKRALKQLQANKHEREERGHISDVIAGWGPRPLVPFSQWSKAEVASGGSGGDASADSGSGAASVGLGGAEKEKELRRLAQRGAVRLFNAIKAAQTTEAAPNALARAGASSSRLAAIKGEAAGGSRRSSSPAGSVTSATSAAGRASPGPAPLEGTINRNPNMLGTKGKQEALANLSKASFLELFKAGGGGAAKPRLAA